MANTIKKGDTISVDYTGKLQTGKVFDTSQGKTPLKFTVGSGMLIKGFDKAVIGMKTGENKTVVIEPEEGYGVRNEELYVDVPKMHFPEDIPLDVGLQLELQDPQGRPVPGIIAEIGEESIKMDINHYLAGKTLEFDIAIVETGLEPDSHQCGSGCDCDSGCNH
ncbi:MAG: peptidylprolyl isomerase [Desulfobacteraceae bacterium]|nr:peptidylprolyl isomerase [Desulfobacteraceae bacterium]